MNEKPVVVGSVDGNVFSVMGAASRVLKQAGMADKATEMSNRVMNSGSYDEALSIVMEYVEFDL
jgi:hypothetical protein